MSRCLAKSRFTSHVAARSRSSAAANSSANSLVVMNGTLTQPRAMNPLNTFEGGRQ